MATAATGWSCTHSASVVSETSTSATIRVTCYWQNVGWNYNINYVSAWVYCGSSSYQVKSSGSVDSTSSDTVSMGYYDFTISKTTAKQSISCYAKITSNSSYVSGTKSSTSTSVSVAAKPSYTVSYNANGGSGTPSSQTKWYGANLTLSSTKPSRTGYTFKTWNTNSSGTGTSYSPGATYTTNAALSLYAIWTANTYTVSYNANGGSGAPSSQTKTYGVNLTLSSTIPTRTNYNFLGWSTSASGSVVYAAGATYSNNSSVTLYAVWELAYTKPRITNFTAQRCTSDGTTSETGTYLKVTFNWATDQSVSYIYIDYKLQTASSWTATQVTASGTSGSVSQIVGSGNISTESSYHVKSYVEDGGGGTHSTTISIGTVKFPIDVKKGGTGVAIGKVSEKDDLFDVNWDAKFKKNLTVANKSWFEQGTSVRRVNNGSGTSGYILACRLTITQNYQNQFIIFGVTQRARCGEIHLNFASADSTDPTLGTFKKIGNIAAFIVKNTTSVWDLYIAKSEAYDDIEITELHKGGYMSGVTIQWINTIASSLPSGYTTATGDITFDGAVNLTATDGTKGYKTNGNIILRNNGSNTVLSAVNGYNLYLRPNGDTNGIGQVLIKTDGKITAYNNTASVYSAVTLYNNTSGSSGTITLYETAANYDYLEIFYAKGTDTSCYKSEKIHSPNGKSVSLITGYWGSDTSVLLYTKTIYISDTSITIGGYGRLSLDGSGGNTITSSTNYIYIYKVLGYK